MSNGYTLGGQGLARAGAYEYLTSRSKGQAWVGGGMAVSGIGLTALGKVMDVVTPAVKKGSLAAATWARDNELISDKAVVPLAAGIGIVGSYVALHAVLPGVVAAGLTALGLSRD